MSLLETLAAFFAVFGRRRQQSKKEGTFSQDIEIDYSRPIGVLTKLRQVDQQFLDKLFRQYYQEVEQQRGSKE